LGDDRALIEQIKQANDIVEVVGGYVALRPAGPTFKGLCPFHDDHRPSFDVDPRRQRYRCWSCGEYGDVLTFVQKHERVDFREAMELLARRAGISLKKAQDSPQQRSRALMLDVLRWAAEQYHHVLLDAPFAETARRYLDERGLTEETIQRYGLGFAPLEGDWLVRQARQAGIAPDRLETVGLIAPRDGGRGWYDRFRDRVMFPIRDAQGRAVGFGGRILPTSPYADRAPKYYNSCDTPLFAKSENLYGLDVARLAAEKAGCLAVVEGYTDVLMAHQMGVPQVVATMGTALNARHVHQLRRWAPRVVLVFDADAGGSTGVDRALEIFAGEDVELAVAMLPEGLDPCDLLVQQGPEPFRTALAAAVDPLDFKLNQILAMEDAGTIDGKRRAVDAVLSVIARVPENSGVAKAAEGRNVARIKQQLMVNRIAQRLGLQENIVWARLQELRAARRPNGREPARRQPTEGEEKRQAPAAAEEKELLQVLLANPALVAEARAEIAADQVKHPGLRCMLDTMYVLDAAGAPATLDAVRARLDDSRLAEAAVRLHDVGRLHPEPAAWLRRLLAEFRRTRRIEPVKQELQNQLQAETDHRAALELLRRLQNETKDPDPDAPDGGARP
jgi:DNA primase